MKKETGITLIALVVTIVVLIILATVSINIIFGEDGIIENANSAKEKQGIAEEQERLELIKPVVASDNKGIVTVEKYVEELLRKGIAVEDEVVDNSDESKQVITDRGYSVNIKQDEENKNNIIITVEGKAGKLKPRIVEVTVISGSNRLTVNVEVLRGEGIEYKYYYKIEGETEYIPYTEEEITEPSCKIENLQQNTNYEIKVEAINKNGKVYIEAKGRTVEVEDAVSAIKFGDLKWDETTHTASVTVTKTKESDNTIEYKIDAGEYKEIENGGTIPSLGLNQVVTVRLWDGTNGGNTTTLNIKDKNVPNTAEISLSGTTTTTNGNITATVTQSDEESGVDISSSRWVYNTSSSETLDESSYPEANKFDEETKDQITLTATTAGTYYLHVLTVDKAGNKTQTISEKIVISEQSSLGYVTNGLMVHYDAINNTGNGHSNTTNKWKNLVSDEYDGALTGGTWSSNYLQLDGSDDWVGIGLIKYPEVTIEVVVAHDESSNVYGINNFDGGGCGLSDYNKTGYNGFMFYVSGSGYQNVDSPTKFNVGQVYSLSGSYNGSKAVLYESGIKYSQNIAGTLSYAANTIYVLGGNAAGQSCGSFSKEKIYSVRIYNRALTDAEVLQNYNTDKSRFPVSEITGGSASETSYVSSGLVVHYDAINNTGSGHSSTTKTWKNLASNSYNGTLTGCTWYSNYLLCNGSSDYVDAGLHEYSKFTIESVYSRVSGESSYTVNTYHGGGYGFGYPHGNNNISVYIGDYQSLASPKSVVNGKIYSLSGSFNNSTLVLFENGTKYQKSLSGTVKHSGYTMQLGRNSGNTGTTWSSNIKLYSVRIYNRVLTDAEVQQNYNVDKARFSF